MNSDSIALAAIAAIATLSFGSPLAAQQPDTELSAEELASRRQSVANLEAHVAQREERLAAIVADIRSLDQRVENGVEKVVSMISRVKDSESSKVRVANIKADVMTGLKRAVDYYDRHRDGIREQLRTGRSALPKETLEKDLAILDAHAEKRLKQILEIAKSFPDPQELAKYETTAVAGWNGWWYANEEISEAWKQNRRDTRHTDSAREGVSKALLDSIEHLQSRNAYLAEKIKSPNVPESERDYYRSEIARNEAVIGLRNSELEEFSSGGATAAVPVMQDEAHELEQLVESARKDLREDFFSIFRKYAELNRARAELKELQNNLAARKAWLESYDARRSK